MCRTCNGELISNWVSSPAMPFTLVAIGTLCQALKFSIWVQVIQAAVKPQAAPAPRIFFAASNTSGQVFGGFEGSSPAFWNQSLLRYITAVELLNGSDSILPSGVE